MTRGRFWLAVALAWLGGAAVAEINEPEPDVQTRWVKDYVIQDSEPEQIETKVVPQSCLDAMQDAERLWRAAARFESISTSQLDIISNARMATADGDIAELNRLDEQQRKLAAKETSSSATIGEVVPMFDQARRECNAETK